MVVKKQPYYNTQQLNAGIKYEMQFGVDRETATRIAKAKLTQIGATYYRRQQVIAPMISRDTSRIKRKLRRKLEAEQYNPFNQGSLFRG